VGRAIVAADYDQAVKELLGPSAAHPEINAEGRRLFAERRYAEAVAAYPRNARTEQRVLYQLSKKSDARRAILSLEEPILRYYLSAFQSAVSTPCWMSASRRHAGLAARGRPGHQARQPRGVRG